MLTVTNIKYKNVFRLYHYKHINKVNLGDEYQNLFSVEQARRNH